MNEPSVIFRGYRFTPPFRCVCCGWEISAEQFAFGGACGPCDCGACQYGNIAYDPDYSHGHPEWWHRHGPTMFERFVEAVGATKEASDA